MSGGGPGISPTMSLPGKVRLPVMPEAAAEGDTNNASLTTTARPTVTIYPTIATDTVFIPIISSIVVVPIIISVVICFLRQEKQLKGSSQVLRKSLP